MIIVNEWLEKYKDVLVGLFGSLSVAFLVISSALFVQLRQAQQKLDGVRQESSETTEQLQDDSEALVSNLEEENEQLRQQLKELQEGLADNGDERVVIDEHQEERNELIEFVKGFTENFSNRNEEIDATRRERLEDYATHPVLEAFAPEDFPYLQFRDEIVGDNFEVDKYAIEVLEEDVYINESSFDDEFLQVFVLQTIREQMENAAHNVEDVILDIRITQTEDGLRVNNVYQPYIQEHHHNHPDPDNLHNHDHAHGEEYEGEHNH